jgi:hypothetical protein
MNDDPTAVHETVEAAPSLPGPALSRPGRMPPPRSAVPAAGAEAAAAPGAPVAGEPPVIELPETAIASDAPPPETPQKEDPLAAGLVEVAERLEGVAASLRGRSVAELLADGADRDPLELLLTGFVLGHASRRREAVEPAADE